ncbi:hypothetical protein KKG90_09130 [Candidatus Bipolaricaulota bacterium]|nr:hypothetical protein [Candidatus Bipolaricaulota bacterium]
MVDPAVSDGFQTYEVPWVQGMSVMDGLDYIYENLDGSIAYYDHAACNQGICKRCLVQINGKTSLMCQTLVIGDMTLEPLPSQEVARDLVTNWGRLEHGN